MNPLWSTIKLGQWVRSSTYGLRIGQIVRDDGNIVYFHPFYDPDYPKPRDYEHGWWSKMSARGEDSVRSSRLEYTLMGGE